MEIGNANYDKKGNTNIFKMVDGDNIYRIFPALGSNAKSGKWYTYKKVEWGYKNSKGKNRPFQDPSEQNFKSKMWEVDTEARRRREKLELQHKQATEMYKKGELTKDEMQKITDLKKQFNLEKKYYVNVINQKGEIGLLKVGYKAFKALEEVIKKLRGEGVDPLSLDNGRFFNFARSGKDFDTAYAVSVVTENVKAIVDGQDMIVQKPIKHVIDESIIKRLDSEAKDLADLDKMYPIITPAQVDRIVKEGPSAVDEILGAGDEQSNDDGDEEAKAAAATASAADAGKSSTESNQTQTSQQTTSLSSTASEAKKEEVTAPKEEAKQETKQETVVPPVTDKAAFLAGLGIN